MNTRRKDQRLLGAWLIQLIAISAVMLSPVPAQAECTNCTTTEVDGDVVHIFSSGSGTFTPPAGVTSVRYLVVGGGGGGGGITNVNAAGAGGGGAGGYLTDTGYPVTPGTDYTVIVGAGGSGAVCGASCTAGTNGGNSTFATITAAGGGRGGYVGASTGAAGGSGGGGRLGQSGGAGNTPATSPSQGNTGGSGDGATTATAGAGGGGGAAASGVNGSGNTGGAGGAGISNDITGAAVTYAGGGGGGGYFGSTPAGVPGAGGAGGGGSAPNGRGPGGNAATNTGGGGGGASGSGSGNAFNGGDGGSGIVIVRYPEPEVIPVAFYQMDEPAWTGAADEVIDASGNNRHGTAQGGADTSSAEPAIPGSPGTCGYGDFDGSSAYVEVPNLSNILNGTASLAFWIRTTQTGNDIGWQAPGVTGVELSGGTDDIFWGWLDASGRIGLSVGNDFNNWKSTTSVNNGTWHHVVLTRDHVAGTFKIYVNGNLENSGAIATGLIGTPFSSIGRVEDTGGPGNYFDGQLDEVRIYDVVLNDEQVDAIMAEVRPCDIDPTLIAEFRMDEALWDGTAGEVTDSTGNGHDGRARTAGGDGSFPNTTPAKVCNGGWFRGEGFNINEPPWWIQARHYVEVPNSPQLSPLAQTGEMTAGGWFRADDLSGPDAYTILHKGQGGATQEYRVYLQEQTLRVTFWNANGGPATLEMASPTIVTGQWYYFGMTAERDGNRLIARLYLFDGNGSLLNSVSGPTTGGPPWNPFFGGAGGDYGSKPLTGNLIFGGTRWGTGDPTNFYDGLLDEIRLYDRVLDQAELQALTMITRPCEDVFIDHIRIEHDGIGLTCTPSTVTISACGDADCTPSALYTDSVTTTLSPSGWVGGDTISFTGGTTTAQLQITTPGIVTLSAGATSPAPLGPSRCFVGAMETCELDFRDALFLFDVPPLTACRESAEVTIAAVRTDDTTQTCAPAFTGPRTVNFWSTYDDPATGTLPVEIDGLAIAGADPGTGIPLTFDGNAEAQFTVRYPDAGQMMLEARYTGSGDDAGLILEGMDSFVSVPVGLAVYSTDANAACDPATPGCSILGMAGESFPLTAHAACWTNDGDFDPGADLSGNPVTPNFRMNDIPLTHDLVAPDPGNSGSLGVGSVSFTAADNGQVTLNQTVSEVGVFTFTATPQADAYFGQTVPGGTSRNIGRFTPYDFNVTLLNDPEFEPGCSNEFTYMDQAFDYAVAPQVTITARNAFGGTTLNYDDDWWMLDDFSEDESHAGAALPGAVSLDSGMAGHVPIDCSGGGCNGQFTTVFSGPFTYMRNGDPQDPFAGGVDIEFSIVDADGIAYAGNPFRIEDIGFAGGNDMQRWGRLRLVNAGGSELLPLAAPVLAEYYDGGYRLNSEDSCTVLSLADDIRLSNPDTDGGNPQPGTAAMTVGGGASSVTSGDVTLADGVGQLIFSAPGAGNVGFIDITTLLSGDLGYLLSDWSGDGLPQDNPVARVTFGIYEGPRSLIFSREPW